jgi:putative membrane protein
MRLNLLSLVLAGTTLCVLPVNTVFAQHGGGTPLQTAQPGTNNPNNPLEQTQDTSAKVDDKKFVKDAALGGMTEVELGKLAAQKASSDAVKQFGQKMVDDHTKANDMLKQVASKENISIPETLDSKHQSRIDKLSKLSGEGFDKAYVKDQLKDHQNDVREFQAEAQRGTDPGIKAFASTTLPTVQQHLDMVKGLNNSTTSSAKEGKGQ